MPRTALIEAVRGSNLQRMQELLDVTKVDLDEDIIEESTLTDTTNDFSNIVVTRTYRSYSRLIDIACQYNHVEVVELLLKEGAAPTKYRNMLSKEDIDWQPLSSCRITSEKLTEAQYKIMKLLILAGADLNDLSRNIFPCSLDLALQQEDEELLSFLHAKGKKEYSIKNARRYEEMLNPNHGLLKAIVKDKSLEDINLLINKGADLEFKDENGNTALLLAALCGRQELVDEFIYRSNSQVINKRGHKLLHCAVVGGLLETVKKTVVKKTINDLDNNGETLIALAIRHGQIAIAQFLFENGAKDLDAKNTLLHQAVNSKSLDSVKFVLDKFGKATLDTVDQQHSTPLWLAVFNDSDEIVNYLLNENADVFVPGLKNKYIFEWKNIRDKIYYPELMCRVADGYCEGLVVEQDMILAEKYYLEAAKNNHAQAQFELSELYRRKFDWFMAVKWQYQAAGNQHVEAQYQYGKSLLYGRGIQKNIDAAKQWLTLAANKKQIEAQNILTHWESNVKQTQNFKVAKKRPADLELYRTEKNPEKPNKRIKVPDKTIYLREWWVANKENFSDPKNEIVANIGLIFTDKPPQKDQLYDLVFETLPVKIPGKADFDIGNFSLKPETFFKRARKRIKEGEQVYSKYQKSANKIKGLNLNFFNRKYTDTSPQKDPNFLKHSEQCYYEYLNLPETARTYLDDFIKQFPSFTPGCKVYCVVMDLYSMRCMCPNCKIATIGMQNPVAENFLNNLQKILVEWGYKVLSKPIGPQAIHLKMVTRVRYDDDSTDYLDNNNVAIKHTNCSKRDIRLLDNMEIFEQKHCIEGDKNTYTAFRSGT